MNPRHTPATPGFIELKKRFLSQITGHIKLSKRLSPRLARPAALALLVTLATMAFFYSGSSASSFYKSSRLALPAKAHAAQTPSTAISNAALEQQSAVSIAAALFPALMLQAQTTTVATFADAAHNTPETDFELGDTVYAKANVPGGASANRRLAWVDPDGLIRKTTPVSSVGFEDSFVLPSTQTSTGPNGTVLHNIGTWRVNIISNRSALVASTSFTVADPNSAIADLSIDTNVSASNSQVTAGSQSTFNIFAANRGPSDAQSVVITDTLPANTTFVSFVKTSGAAFTCTAPESNVVTCTLGTFTSGSDASFTLNYTVNPGTAAGTQITNTVAISSATTERNNSDNTSSASAQVVAGNTATCTLDCPDDINVAANTTEGGQEGAHVVFAGATPDGDCGTVTSSPASGSFFPVGTTTVTSTSGLGGGSCTFTVTVTGTAPVTISCPPDQTVHAADGECNTTVVTGTATATATSGHVTVTGVRSDHQPLNAPYPGGTTTITWTATDDATPEPHTASCTQLITVEVSNVNDPTPPTITAPPNVTVSTGTAVNSSCSAVVDDATIGEPTVNDNCSASFTSSGIPAGNDFPVGTTTITWTATDGAGNTASATQTVTVHDAAPPVITLNGSSSVTVECHTSFTDPGATAHDSCAGDFAATASGNVNINAPGNYTITYNATDPSGNAAAPVTRTVHVVDTTPPTITLNGSNPMTVECHTSFTDPGATAHDGCSGDFAATASGTVNVNVPGSYTLTYNASDPSGNAATAVTRTVNVVDTTAPTITLKNVTISLWPPNHKYQTVNIADLVASASDGCDGSVSINNVVISKVTSDETENGNGDGNTLNDIVIAANCKSVQLRSERDGGGNGRVYTITFLVRDAAGNTTTKTAKVTVPENQNGSAAIDSGVHYTVNSACQ
jgi:uncharacterized repeat protein (TIGR01451 family)